MALRRRVWHLRNELGLRADLNMPSGLIQPRAEWHLRAVMAKQIASFQSGRKPLFLISLKAGGTALNLGAADTVVIYDPWWN